MIQRFLIAALIYLIRLYFREYSSSQNKKLGLYLTWYLWSAVCSSLLFCMHWPSSSGLKINTLHAHYPFEAKSIDLNYLLCNIVFSTINSYCSLGLYKIVWKNIDCNIFGKACTIFYIHTVFENHRKSIIQHCERSELRLHFEWTKVNKKWKENRPFWRVFENLKLAVKQCYQTGHF